MGQTNIGVVWSQRTHIQMPEMTVMMNLVNTECLTGTCDLGYGL